MYLYINMLKSYILHKLIINLLQNRVKKRAVTSNGVPVLLVLPVLPVMNILFGFNTNA